MLRVTLNGQSAEFPEGVSILQALRARGIEVPTLCHDGRLKPYGGCRLCIVQVKGIERPVTACNAPLADGMGIETHTPEIEDLRTTLLRLLAQRYPAEAVQRFPEKAFHAQLRAYGLGDELRGEPDPALVDDSHPYIHIDMSQCIYCYRCVRICEEVQGQFVWQVWNRGDQTRILPDSGTTLLESSCVSCGACVDTCPTGALIDKTVLAHGVPTQRTKTTCPYCGTGCEMLVGTRGGRIVDVEPAQDAPVSKGHLCVKGRYAFEFVYAADRVTSPLIRDNGKWKRASWDEAIAFTAEGLERCVERYGPVSVGVLGSARATNEENYLAQKFARLVLGTNNTDCCARVCHAPTAAGMKMMLGAGAATNSFDDIERACTILVFGANATENHPIVGARIKQAVLQGANLIVIDPREIELARYATVHLPLRPGTNVPMLNALAHVIVEEGLYDGDFVRERVAEWENFQSFLKAWPPDRSAGICDVDTSLIRNAARLYATRKPSMCFHGLGMTEHIGGTEGVMCLVNLALLTGNIGKPGTGINPLRGQNNVQGAATMGCDPGNLTGSVALQEGKDLFESVWKGPVPTTRGLNLLEMMDAALAGKFKGLWAIGYDVFLTNADAQITRKAMESLEFVAVQDMFMNETAKEFGSVFLPSSSSFEKDGTFMNAERRIQRVRKVAPPLGESRPDWEIICSVARALGKGEFFGFQSVQEVWNEIRAVWRGSSGITYERLEHGGLQWPCLSENDPGTKLLHRERFAIGRRAALRPVPFNATPEIVNEEFPFLLVTGRTLYQFNAGTMTMRTANAKLHPTDFLDVSPEDARRLGIENGQRVRIRSRHGEAALPVRIKGSVKLGEVFATFHSPEVFLNRVTSPYRDRYVGTPEYKLTAIRIEKLE
jgi:formate dehydrogenase major subunit